MKRIFIIALLLLGSGYVARAQEVQCPQNYVCISREAALKALADAEKVAALEKEKAAYEKALGEYKSNLEALRAEYAKLSGENTVLKQRAVSDAALIELLIKMARPKKIGLINLF